MAAETAAQTLSEVKAAMKINYFDDPAFLEEQIQNLTNRKKEMAFTHLHVHTEFSLLDGSNKIKEYVARVKELGMNSAAITDHGVMFGVIDFYKAAKAAGINPILGCEVYVAPNSRFDREAAHGEDRYYHLVLLAENNEGYQNLMKIVSKGFVDGYYYKTPCGYGSITAVSQWNHCAEAACLAGEVQRYLVKRTL
mgnify:CR=1 FL=1